MSILGTIIIGWIIWKVFFDRGETDNPGRQIEYKPIGGGKDKNAVQVTLICPLCGEENRGRLYRDGYTCSSCYQEMLVEKCPSCDGVVGYNHNGLSGPCASCGDLLLVQGCDSCQSVFVLSGEEQQTCCPNCRAGLDAVFGFGVFEVLVCLAVEMMAADGHIDEEEIQALLAAVYELGEGDSEMLEDAGGLIERFRRRRPDIDKLLLKAAVYIDKETARIMMIVLFNIAYADGEFHKSEEALLRRISRKLKMSAAEFKRLADEFAATGSADAESCAEILGITPGMSRDEARKVYRKLVMTHHPDRYSGAFKEERQAARLRFHEIQQAWEVYSQKQGW